MNEMGRGILLLAGLLAAGIGSCPSAAAAGLTPDQARARVESEFGVQVLKVQRAERDGKPIYLITVMNPAGDFNNAFQVNTLAVDAATGRLLPTFHQLPSGRAENEAPSRTFDRQPEDAFRRGFSWR